MWQWIRTTYDSKVAPWIAPVLIGIVVAGVLGSLIWYLPILQRKHWEEPWRNQTAPSQKELFDIENEARKTVATVVGGCLAVLALYLGWCRVRVSQETSITDRYTKAVEQLGSKKMEVRLGGLYALERIAQDSQRDHSMIMEVLTAYVRKRAPVMKEAGPAVGEDNEYPAVAVVEQKVPSTDIQAVLTILTRRYWKETEKETNRLDLSNCDICYARAEIGASLIGINLSRADARSASFDSADLRNANLRGANLMDTDFKNVKLNDADLSDARLVSAKLYGADLKNANLNDADLTGADLTMARLIFADLRDADLTDADLIGADLTTARLMNTRLSGANIGGAYLRSTDFTGADLKGARLVSASLRGANLKNARLRGADLRFADLTGANLKGADLSGADLREVAVEEFRIYFVKTLFSCKLPPLLDQRLKVSHEELFEAPESEV
jgi:uncharacterized protein YjbI with pentapeptide repeats